MSERGKGDGGIERDRGSSKSSIARLCSLGWQIMVVDAGIERFTYHQNRELARSERSLVLGGWFALSASCAILVRS